MKALTLLFLLTLGAAEDPRSHASWWLATYGPTRVTPEARRAESVFGRVAAAAEKRRIEPRLVLIDRPGGPFALALPDGSIVLTQGALDLCFRRLDASRAEVCLAFVLGHELAHLVQDDFWHARAFSALRETAEASPSLLADLRPSHGASRLRELEADRRGFLYLTMAGYEPGLLLTDAGFFRGWATREEAEGSYQSLGHPSPKDRADFLRSEMELVAAGLERFHWGARLYQLGRYEDALVLLRSFAETYPSREVLSNLGLVHLQLALRALARCDGAAAVRFLLPARVDPETLARRIRSRGEEAPCFRRPAVSSSLRAAERDLRRSVESDPSYLPARRNLIALLLVSGRGAGAWDEIEAALPLAPDDPELLGTRSLALYLMGRTLGQDTTDRALEELRRLLDGHPGHPALLYNLASILTERERLAAARTYWERYLETQPGRGPFAQVAREWLGREHPAAESPEATVPSPLPLGPLREADRQGLRATEVTLGEFRATFLRGEGFRALAIGSTVEVVEVDLAEGVRLPQQEPMDRVPTVLGAFLRYEGVGFDVSAGEPRRRVHFFDPSR